MRRLILLPIILGTIFSMTPARAESQYKIKEMTPEVQEALDGRKGRFDKLSEFKSQGIIGENNRGYVELLTDDADAKKLVDQENENRQTIYATIAKQNGIEDEIATIERVFAQVQRDKADDGEMIQSEDGIWSKK